MVDAVSSVVTNAQFVRSTVEQASSARSTQVEATPIVVPKAPYISPFISIDNNFDTAVLQIRDSDTGDVVRQFPSESTLRARQNAEQAQRVEALNTQIASSSAPTSGEIGVSEIGGSDSNGGSTVNLAQAQVASNALTAAAQTSQIAQATVSTSA